MTFGLIEKDVLKDILRQLVLIEKDRQGLKEDMADLKMEFGTLVNKKLVGKILKVALNKGLKEYEIDDYMLACQMLGKSFPCGVYMPTDVEMTPEMSDQRKKLLSLVERYKNLQDEHNELSVQIRNKYAEAKAKGISVPMLKKAVDFCVHPDKLREYYDSNPLLESYVQVVEEID
jgi:uncharacterized protein (UPF0335 family)